MSIRRMAVLQACFLLVAILANAAVRNGAIRVTVLDSQSRSVSLGTNDVPKNCDQVNFDAYCNNSNSAIVTNTLLVREDNSPPYYVSCTVDSRFSRCKPLPKGESFEARREKHGVIVYYVDDRGKARSQLYTFVDASGKAAPPPAIAQSAGQPPAAQSSSVAVPTSPPAAPARRSVPANGGSAAVAPQATAQKVRCTFTSTPPDADITIDGSYVGNTPSEIGLATGKHVVVIAKVGFGEWRRELTVTTDSVVNLTANLQTQP
jgi:hypothetical protein